MTSPQNLTHEWHLYLPTRESRTNNNTKKKERGLLSLIKSSHIGHVGIVYYCKQRILCRLQRLSTFSVG